MVQGFLRCRVGIAQDQLYVGKAVYVGGRPDRNGIIVEVGPNHTAKMKYSRSKRVSQWMSTWQLSDLDVYFQTVTTYASSAAGFKSQTDEAFKAYKAKMSKQGINI